MEINLNGNPYELPRDVHTVKQLLDHLELSERIVIVEINQDIVQKTEYDRPIRDRDEIEMIHFVGGG